MCDRNTARPHTVAHDGWVGPAEHWNAANLATTADAASSKLLPALCAQSSSDSTNPVKAESRQNFNFEKPNAQRC